MAKLPSNYLLVLAIIYRECQKTPSLIVPRDHITKIFKDIEKNEKQLFNLDLKDKSFDRLLAELNTRGFTKSNKMDTTNLPAKNMVSLELTPEGKRFLEKYGQKFCSCFKRT